MAQEGWSELQEAAPDSSKPFHRANIPRDLSAPKWLQDLRPFTPPPVPAANAQQTTPKRTSTRSKDRSPRSRQWKTTIIVTEYTTPSGEKAFSASGTPLEQMPAGPAVPVVMHEPEPAIIHRNTIRQPFLNRMRRRRITYYNRLQHISMIALSVKRQRKLKMKKKKFKKLMKRTRNLRRKLGKL
jgi:Mitochondrial domain of unknown function (DUF1713)